MSKGKERRSSKKSIEQIITCRQEDYIYIYIQARKSIQEWLQTNFSKGEKRLRRPYTFVHRTLLCMEIHVE